MVDLNAAPIIAEVASRLSDGTAPGTVATGATMQVGGTAGSNGNYAMLRFDCAALAALEITSLILELTIATSNTPGKAFQCWVANFDATITEADYVRTIANALEDYTNAFRVPLKTIISAAVPVVAGTKIQVRIPTHLVRLGDDNFLDILITGVDTGSLLAGDVVTFHGQGAATATDRPRLLGEAYTEAELYDPRKSSGVRCPRTGDAVMAVGFAIESDYAVPVKPRIGLMTDNYSLTGEPRNLVSNAKTRELTKPSMLSPGRDSSSGDISFEVTPESWVALLMGMFKIATTTDLGVIEGRQVYEHVLYPTDQCEDNSFTFWNVEGFEQLIHRGVKLASLGVTVPEDGIVTLGAGMAGLGCYRYDANSAGVNSEYLLSSGYSTDRSQGVISDRQVVTTLDGIAETSLMVNSSSVNITRAIDPIHGQNGERSATMMAVGKPMIGATLDMTFRTEAQVRAYYGVDHLQYPYKSLPKVVEQALSISLNGQLGSNIQKIQIDLPKMAYTQVSVNQQEDRAVRIVASASGNVDTTINSGVKITLRCSHPASYFAPSTDLIYVLPVGETIITA